MTDLPLGDFVKLLLIFFVFICGGYEIVGSAANGNIQLCILIIVVLCVLFIVSTSEDWIQHHHRRADGYH